MLIILVFCIYVIATGRVSITRSLTLTGLRARQFAVTLLVLMIPVQIAADALIVRVISPSIFRNPVTGRLINVAVLMLLGILLAVGFRAIDKRSPAPADKIP